MTDDSPVFSTALVCKNLSTWGVMAAYERFDWAESCLISAFCAIAFPMVKRSCCATWAWTLETTSSVLDDLVGLPVCFSTSISG